MPKEVVGLLQLKGDFCLPPTNNVDSITQCIKHIENNFSRLQSNNSINKFRNQIFPFINNLNKNHKLRTETECKLITASQTTRNFIKNNPDLYYSPEQIRTTP